MDPHPMLECVISFRLSMTYVFATERFKYYYFLIIIRQEMEY